MKGHGVVERLERETRSSPTTTDLKRLTAKPASNQDRELGFESSHLLLSVRFFKELKVQSRKKDQGQGEDGVGSRMIERSRSQGGQANRVCAAYAWLHFLIQRPLLDNNETP